MTSRGHSTVSDMITLRHASGSAAEVAVRGAQLRSWRTGDGREQLFLARSAVNGGSATTPARGGIPIIFPQFGPFGPLAKHGFARTSQWTVEATDAESCTLRLVDDDATRAGWPHAFQAELTVRLDSATAISQELRIMNTDVKPFEFTAALHTYLAVADVSRAWVLGLEGARYIDRSASPAREMTTLDGAPYATDEVDALAITGTMDRIYPGAPRMVRLTEPGHVVTLERRGFDDLVVWNPGEDAGAIADLAEGEAQRFVCVEAAQVRSPVRLAPGARWAGAQRLAAAGASA